MPDKERLEQVCKMAELGLMTASLMHEMRQPLWAIKANMQLMMVQSDAEARERHCQQMTHGIEAIERLIGLVVDFARAPATGQAGDMEEIDLNAPLQGALNMLEYKMAPSRLVLHSALTPGLPTIRGSYQGLLQVFLNLMHNSLDALEGVQERHLWVISRLSAGGEVEVLIGDSGEGIPAGVAEQVFEYFFTTKPRGKGTGLGLAISLEIVRSHGGVLELVRPEERPHTPLNGGGPEPVTLFRLSLPAAQPPEFEVVPTPQPTPAP